MKWATAVAKILACNNIERAQVQKLLEIVNSAHRDPFFTLEAFVLYQAARAWRSKHAARLFVEAVNWLRERGAGAEELRTALGYVKWIYRAYERVKKPAVCPRYNAWQQIRFEQFVQQVDPSRELLALAQNIV